MEPDHQHFSRAPHRHERLLAASDCSDDSLSLEDIPLTGASCGCSGRSERSATPVPVGDHARWKNGCQRLPRANSHQYHLTRCLHSYREPLGYA